MMKIKTVNGVRKNKNRHLNKTERRKYSVYKEGVQVFPAQIVNAIPFNDIKGLTTEKLQEDYIGKASDSSVIPFQQYFTVVTNPEPAKGTTGIEIDKPAKETTFSKVINEDGEKDLQNNSINIDNDAIKKFFNIKEIVNS